MISAIKLDLCLLNFVCLVEDHCCATFVSSFRFIAALFLSSFTAAYRLHDRLYFGFSMFISEMATLTCSK